MELMTWSVADRLHVRVVEGDARLEVQLPPDEGTEEQIETLAGHLWDVLQEQRRFLRGEF
jgi:hypothetical protein